MAFTFAEEFAALGYDERRLLELFRRPGYGGPYQAYRVLGEPEIRRIIRESLTLWGGFRVVVQDSSPDPPRGPEGLVRIGSREGTVPSGSEEDE
jgi:hypothetical protein